MGKAQEGVAPLESPHSEASKLLEAALQQMDGIISGVCLDGVETPVGSAVREAAERLVAILQESPLLPPPPDPAIGNILRLWIAQQQQRQEAPGPSPYRRHPSATSLARPPLLANTDSETDSSACSRHGTPLQRVGSSFDESTVKCGMWSDSAHEDSLADSLTSCESTSSSNRYHVPKDMDTLDCEEDFQWIRNCDEQLNCLSERAKVKSPVNSSGKVKEPVGKPPDSGVAVGKASSVELRRERSRSRKERDVKSKSSILYYQSPSRNTDLRFQKGLCYNCLGSLRQDLPLHRYGSSPGLDQICQAHHWQPSPLCCQHQYHNYYPCENTCSYRFMKGGNELEEQLRRLQGEKESLSLQVTVLSEQIEAQTEKISDLEKALDENKKQLNNAGDLLQREVLSRSSLETQKLELLALVSELKRQEAILERDNADLRERLSEERRRHKPPPAPRSVSTSTPTNQILSRGASPSPSPVSLASTLSPRKVQDQHEESVHNQQGVMLGMPVRRVVDTTYSSLPRGSGLTEANTPQRRGVAFAETETVHITDNVSEVDNSTYSQQTSPSLQIRKTKGIKKILGRIKRSGSGNLDDLPGESEFRRGGIRSTAGARLGWSNNNQRCELPFGEWGTEAVCDWLVSLGLEGCVVEAKRWLKSGAQLLAATPYEVEKELSLKNAFHCKKLQLALYCERDAPGDSLLVEAGKLDTGWVLRWLDDVGLPQYKEPFLNARIDGRLLHRMTQDDLGTMHCTSQLHAASIRTGIKVLRLNNFDSSSLIRRSNPETGSGGGSGEVAQWTNHRVMEWLRVVDLAEYAPNLRGSGVHGGLMVYEVRFTAELLAGLLSIPTSKTLLRRHLSTHFKELLGRDVIQEKRQAEATIGYMPLSTTAKIKVAKKSQFTLKRKKSKGELDYGELLCPLEEPTRGQQSGDNTTNHPNLVGVSLENGTYSSQNSLQERMSDRSSNI